jgi:hypothetical protein
MNPRSSTMMFYPATRDHLVEAVHRILVCRYAMRPAIIRPVRSGALDPGSMEPPPSRASRSADSRPALCWTITTGADGVSPVPRVFLVADLFRSTWPLLSVFNPRCSK